MGGSASQEFMVYTDAGEDLIASCASSGYAANLEKATSRLEPVGGSRPTGDGQPELVHTPASGPSKRLEPSSRFNRSTEIKTMAYMAALPEADHAKLGALRPVVVFLRGDHIAERDQALRPGRRSSCVP